MNASKIQMLIFYLLYTVFMDTITQILIISYYKQTTFTSLSQEYEQEIGIVVGNLCLNIYSIGNFFIY